MFGSHGTGQGLLEMWPQTNKERERKREKARRRDGEEEEGERVSGVSGFRRLCSGGG